MANKIYPFQIDPPTTVNKTKSLQLPLDKTSGPAFRIERLFIEVPDLDAITATSVVAVMISTIIHNEETALLDIGEKELIMKQTLYFHLAEATLTEVKVNLNDNMFELENFRGVFLDVSVKNYITSLITGQDGAIAMNVAIEGQYVSKEKGDWNYNLF